MKPGAFLSTCSIILFIKNINGQHNGLVYNENLETKNPVSQQLSTRKYTIVQDILKQNGNTAPIPYKINDHPISMQTNTPPSSPCSQQIQLPPDLQQPLQVQQHSQLQKSLQSQQLQPQVQAQPLLQSHNPLRAQTEALLPLSMQSQDILRLQTQNQVQPMLQTQQPLGTQQILQNQQLFNFQQHLQTPSNLQQTLHSSDYLQAPQPIQLQQQSITLQQMSPIVTETKHLNEIPVTHRKNSNLPNSQIQVNWKTLNPQTMMNVESPYNVQNLNNQPQQNYINRPVDIIRNSEKSSEKPQEVSSLRYYVLPQQPSPPTPSASIPVVSTSESLAAIPSSYIKPVGETYVPITAPYNYVMPTSEIQLPVPEVPKTTNTVFVPTPILTVPSPPIQNTNMQTYYYNNQRGTESNQNSYINLNSGFRYPEQPQFSVPVLKIQPTPVASSSSSISSSIPISVVKVPSLSPQYAVSSGYPVNTIVTPSYTTYRPKSSNLKSILPLIFNLLREKIAACNNDCSCDCKNDKRDNNVEVAVEYSSQKDYSPFNLSAESEGLECVREPKNCEKIKNVSTDVSDETLEEEDLDEEEVQEDEDD